MIKYTYKRPDPVTNDLEKVEVTLKMDKEELVALAVSVDLAGAYLKSKAPPGDPMIGTVERVGAELADIVSAVPDD